MKYLDPNNLKRGDEMLAQIEIAYQLERIADALNGNTDDERDIIKINLKKGS